MALAEHCDTERLVSTLHGDDQSRGRAMTTLYIAIPIALPSRWVVLTSMSDCPPGHTIIARIGANRRAAAVFDNAVKPASTTELPSELEELLGYFARMNNQQRAGLLEAAR